MADDGLFTPEEREAREQNVDYKRLKKQLLTVESESEKEEIRKELQATEEMLSLNKEITKLEKSVKRSCYPYLKTTMPIYRDHEYEEYKIKFKGEDLATNTMW